jgi:hypothetical protein
MLGQAIGPIIEFGIGQPSSRRVERDPVTRDVSDPLE